MRWFLDTEFHERGHKHPIELISVALVSEDGFCYRAVSQEFDVDAAMDNPWLAKHVMPKLLPQHNWKSRSVIALDIEHLLLSPRANDPQPKPEIWAYFADYDWVVFCQLWGSMVQLPKGMPMFCMDFKQRMVERSITREDLPDMEPGKEHDALEDALWLRRCVQSTDHLGL